MVVVALEVVGCGSHGLWVLWVATGLCSGPLVVAWSWIVVVQGLWAVGFSGCTTMNYGNYCFGVMVVAVVVWKREIDGGQFDMREREREYGEDRESE